MSYLVMSVKEAVNHVSANVNGWYLPAVQRPYVWGSRYESEKFICKLFDSILQGYPIGGLIVWNNPNEMHYREFLRDYQPTVIPNFVEKGLWGRPDKWLVYDGQQRLQTLYSCLKFTMNGKVLTFDLSYKPSEEEADDTGFAFYAINEDTPSHIVRMNELFIMPENEKVPFRRRLIDRIKDSAFNFDVLEDNLDLLWDVFVKTEKKSIAYFPVKSSDERTVNEIFQRLNTGGVPLSQSDLLFSKIKEHKPDFEEELQLFSREIYQKTGNGYFFEADQMLQLLNLIVRKGIRIAPEKTTNHEITQFVAQWASLRRALLEFFSNFIWESFKINNKAIVPRQLAIFPLIVFFKIADEKNVNFRKLDNSTLQNLKKYFILSQVNDWNLQSIIDGFTRILVEQNAKSQEPIFPYGEFIAHLEQKKQRNTVLYEKVFTGFDWFALKILMPNRVYLFEPDSRGRFNPEIDHIFPRSLQTQDTTYKDEVDTIWNKQPVKGEVNNYKRRREPAEFFASEDGAKYFSDYDFIVSPTNAEWQDWKVFFANRRKRMIDALQAIYDLELLMG